MKYCSDATDMIGRTPLLRMGRLAKDHRLFAKCEFTLSGDNSQTPVKAMGAL